MSYPKMIYRKGMLSSDAADQRTVDSAEAEMAAGAQGFKAWTGKKQPGAAGVTSAEAADKQAFSAAGTVVPPPAKEDAE